jgi:hypothetical protein
MHNSGSPLCPSTTDRSELDSPASCEPQWISASLLDVLAVRACVTALTLLTFASACTSHSTSRPQGRSERTDASQSIAQSAQWATFRNETVSFRYPNDWHAVHFDETSSFTASIADLSSQTMHAPCTTRHTSTGTETSCGWPVMYLRPGGILMRWEQNGFPVPRSWRFRDQPGQRLLVDGRPARQTINRPGDCSHLGATETIRTEIKRSAVGNDFSVTACLRGPGIDSLESRARAILASTHLLQP